MSDPLPLPLFHIVSALSGHMSRRPSNVPAAAFWLLNPTTPRISYDQRDAMMMKYLEYLYSFFPEEYVALLRAEAAGMQPLAALELFSNHLDDWVYF